MMREFQLMALTPAGLIDPSIAIAASRAGELGVLNLAYTSDWTQAQDAIVRMTRYVRSDWGVKLDNADAPLLERLLQQVPDQLQVVILIPSDPSALPQQVATLRQHGLFPLLEVTDLEEALLGQDLDVDGLVAKGHEAGGWVGEETGFILLQRLLCQVELPVWAFGGIGLHTAAACYAVGAAGVVLEAQLALTRESPLPDPVRRAIGTMDGSETVCLGRELERLCRVYARPDAASAKELGQLALDLAQTEAPGPEVADRWRQAVRERVGWGPPEESVWLLSQDAAFAAPLASRYRTVSGVLGAVREAVRAHVRVAGNLRPLDENSPLAVSHATRYPIVQGPMTRVSDQAEFARSVADGGALPFLALALMRAPQVEALLSETQQLLGERPWGVGILGFVPLDLRQEQIQVIRRYRPPFALIAGGRPDQARTLEKEGIPTYLHVPSPGLLRLFLEDGARRFVFEGRECGGHVGPRTSFVLWNTMIDVLLEDLPAGQAADCHVLFAGGIHDARSAAMVATMAAPLAERGARIGVLLGTSYLFTQEVVTSGAILPGFQEAALRCENTVLLESGPGHATRCVPTPYFKAFEQERRRLEAEGEAPEQIRQALEELNVGRLRIAAKGITRHPRYDNDPDVPKFVTLTANEQHDQGLYMIGQLAALRDRVCTIAELHHDIAVQGTRLVESLSEAPEVVSTPMAVKPSEIAIVGMSGVLPKAGDLQTFWENILNKVDAITEIPRERWDAGLFYDPDRDAQDKIYSKWGGFIDDVPFDPISFGMPPSSLSSIDPMHMLALVVAREALADAGYAERPFDRGRTSVILGASGGVGDLGAAYVLRSGLPLLYGERGFKDAQAAADALPEWTEDSFAGLLLNVAAGRVANRFDFGGLNFVVDAACASSLTAVHLAVKELETHNTDVVIAGGVDTVQNPFGYLCFSKTQALSPTGQPRVFDATADGIVISEGVVMLVLKRLADAERDGDRIYAVIQAVNGSSDGRGMGMTAPRPEGQALAFQRAYAKAGFSPITVGLFEAHGTGTVVGDRTEALSLSNFLEAAGASPAQHAIGSIKSMIGHTKASAGVVGLVKVALALHHKVLPPTLGVTQPNPQAHFGEGPLYVNTETRPWLHSGQDTPRRAGVSAFGFGGTNFHAVLEEYTGDFLPAARDAPAQRWPSELLLFAANSHRELLSEVGSLQETLAQGAEPELADLAHTLWSRAADRGDVELRLAVVASSLDDLQSKLAALPSNPPPMGGDPGGGIYLSPERRDGSAKVAFLFPGQGSQYPDMLRDLAIRFAEVRETIEHAERVLGSRLPRPLGQYVYPPPAFTPEAKRSQREALTQTNVAQPALGAADMALFRLLGELGLAPDMVAGHSYGEYAALCAAGVVDLETLAVLSEARGRAIIEAAEEDLGTMAAVRADRNRVVALLEKLEEVWIANLNAPRQTIISGTKDGIGRALDRFAVEGISARTIPVACAFHSPLVAPAQERLAEVLAQTRFHAPALEVFSNTSAAAYPCEPRAIRELLALHLVRPVRFCDEIEAMYAAGARLFVEVGPRSVLTGLVRQTLGDHPHVALSTDIPGQHGLTQLQRVLGQLYVHGLPVRLERLFQGRQVRQLRLEALVQETQKPLSPTTWLVNGSRARPLHAPPDENRHPPLERATREPADSIPLASPPSGGELEGGEAVSPLRRRGIEGGEAPGSIATPPPSSEPVAGAPFHPATPDAPVGDGEVAQVMLQYQRLMGRFLESQKSVMLSYLQRARKGSLPVEGAFAEASPGSRTATPAPPQTLDDREVKEAAAVLSDSRGKQDLPVSDRELSESGDTDAAPVLDREQLMHKLLQVVSERTGYPTEMLDPDVDIEADLGIDSIKRVEILGNLQRTYLDGGTQFDQGMMEQLTGIKTLQGIVDWLDEALGSNAGPDLRQDLPPAEPEDAAHPPPQLLRSDPTGSPDTNLLPTVDPELAPDTLDDGGLNRLTLSVVDGPPVDAGPLNFPADRVVLITDDGSGLAPELARRVRSDGGRVAVVRLSDATPIGSPPDWGGTKGGVEFYEADLTDPDAVEMLITSVRQRQGPIAGIFHLLPHSDSDDLTALDLTAWQLRLRREVKGLFYLARAAANDLKRSALSLASPPLGGTEGGESADAGAAWLIAATSMGRAYASDPDERSPFFPGQGGIPGLLKTLSLEWPSVHCAAVHLDPHSPLDVRAGQLIQEAATDQGPAEVGYIGKRRWLLQPSPTPLDIEAPPHLAVESDWVILVTGGARGITAEVACELAERYQPTLVLVGRSPLPPSVEPGSTAGVTSPQELKAALMERMRQEGIDFTLSDVEAAYNRLLQAREMRRNLGKMERAGATIHYVQGDVRDEGGMAELVAAVYRDYGRLDGVIHGAGVIEDKLIEDKTPHSFDRVFDTKADGAFLLSRLLRPESLRFLALFSSAAGPFGNRGQCDYAAANEVLNKLALDLDRRWPGRVFSINWGPWAKAGMVSPELQREFARRGVALIPIPAGRRTLLRELLYGSKGEAEVIVTGGGGWGVSAETPRVEAKARASFAPTLPLLQRATFAKEKAGAVEVARTLDPAYDLYLRDHQLDGKPVLPLAMAMELMAEVVQHGWPDLELVRILDLNVLRGVILENGPKTVQLVARAQTEAPHEWLGARVNVEIRDLQRTDRPFYRATVELADRPLERPQAGPLPDGFNPFPSSVSDAYRRWLFQGPLFQGIAEIEGISERGMVALCTPSSPESCLAGGPAGRWLIDPVVFDSGLQLIILWARTHTDMTPLPARFHRYRRYRPLAGPVIRCHMQALASPDGHTVKTNLHFLDPDGRLLGVLENLECNSSRALNRLVERGPE